MFDPKRFSGFSLFSAIPQDKLAEIGHFTETIEFRAQEVIFQEGAAARNLYGVLSGSVELSLIFRDRILKPDIQYEEVNRSRIEILEKNIVIDTMVAGEIFGWSSMINPRLMTSTATCSQATQVFSVPADRLKSVLLKDGRAGYAFMEGLAEIVSHRMKHLTDKLIESWTEAFAVQEI
jgi:CRP-like cAMP-binding protein